MRADHDFIKQWERIVSDVDKDLIPIDCVKKVIFKHVGNKQKTINLKALKRQNLNTDEIGAVVDRYVQENESTIRNMEFVLDVEAIAELLQPETDKLLKDI